MEKKCLLLSTFQAPLTLLTNSAVVQDLPLQDLLGEEKFTDDNFLQVVHRQMQMQRWGGCIGIDCSTISNQHHLFGQSSSLANSLTVKRSPGKIWLNVDNNLKIYRA